MFKDNGEARAGARGKDFGRRCGAEVELELDGVKRTVKAAISGTLPVSVLLETDVPELGLLLRANPSTINTRGVEEFLIVTTRAQSRRKEMAEAAQAEREEISGTRPSPIAREEVDLKEYQGVSSEGLFQGGKRRNIRQTKKQKREERHRHGLVRAKDRPGAGRGVGYSLGITRAELQHLQEVDETLVMARKAAEGKTVDAASFFKKDGLLYR